MKKGCLAVLSAIIVLLVGGAGYFYYQANAQLGLAEAPAISYTTFINPETRVLAKLDTDKLADYLLNLVPLETLEVAKEIPGWLPWTPEELVRKVTPREVALIGAPKLDADRLEFTLFANERSLGPIVAQQANQQNILFKAPMVQWSEDLVQAPERGILKVDGALATPEGLKAELGAHWAKLAESKAPALEGKHLIELATDNLNGEGYALVATIVEMTGNSWATLKQHPQFKIAENILVGIEHLHAWANITSRDQLTINLRIECPRKIGKQIEFLSRAGLGEARKSLEEKQGMVLKGAPEYNEEEEAVLATFTLSGFADKLVALLEKNLNEAA